jgi:hypothetical protein
MKYGDLLTTKEAAEMLRVSRDLSLAVARKTPKNQGRKPNNDPFVRVGTAN